MNTKTTAWVGLACVAMLSGSTAGQCHQWLQNMTVSPPAVTAFSGFVATDFHVADLDGPGPLPDELFFGSMLSNSGGVTNDQGGVVRWNGSRFLVMPGRISYTDGNAQFYDFEVHQGRFFASGKFNYINSTFNNGNLIEFRSALWQRPLANTGQSIQSLDAFQMLSDGTRLLVVGQNLSVNGFPSTLARLENGQWSSMRPYAGSGSNLGTAVARYGDSLMVGLKESTSQGILAIDRFQSGAFSPSFYAENSCVPFSLTVRKFQVLDGSLYACGNFYPVPVPPFQMTPLLRWNGVQWVDAGYPGEAVGTGLADIHGLARLNGSTYAYGSTCGRVPALARLEANGAWTQVPVPSQLNIPDGPAAFFGGITYDNKLFLGSRGQSGISMFDGTNWQFFVPSLGTSAAPTGMLVEGDDVYICGARNGLWAQYGTPNSPSIPTTPVGKLTANGWMPVGSGLPADGLQVLRWRNYLVVRTGFGIRFLDSDQWLSLVPTLTSASTMTVWNDNLIVENNGIVYSFDGIALTPMSSVSPPRAFNGGIFKAEVHEGQLMLCGSFTQISRAGETPIPRNSLVVWDGAEWQNFGPNAITGTVANMFSSGSDLFLSGSAIRVDNVLQTNTARWDGTAWTQTQGIAATFGVFTAMGSTVYRASGAIPARFDTTTNSWIGLRGMSIASGGTIITGMAPDPQQRWLHAVGNVTAANDHGVLGYARLSMGQPILERQPQDFTANQGDVSAFSFDILTQRATYQWRKDGNNIVQGTTSWGSSIRGTDTPYLIINNTQLQDQGVYDCVVTATCQGTPVAIGTTTTQPAMLAVNVRPTCDSIDFNNDGSMFDPQDIEAFLSVYSEGPCVPATATCNDIDFNNDTLIFDPQDIASFLSVYSEGPCL